MSEKAQDLVADAVEHDLLIDATEQGLHNPALALMATNEKAQDLAVSTVKTILISSVALTFVYIGYKMFSNRFKKLNEDSRYPKSNISDSQAETRANAIYTAMYGFGANYEMVQENLSGLNHNGFIKVYNAFGKRSAVGFGDMNMVEWLINQFSESELARLRFLIPGFF